MNYNSTRCLGDLHGAADPLPASMPLVRYQSKGTLLIIHPSEDQLGVIQHSKWPRRMVVVHGEDLCWPQPPDDRGAVVSRPGRIVALQGWLGRFQAHELDAPGMEPRIHDTTGKGAFDLVIDCSSVALMDQEVPPFGYFHARSGEALAAALSAAEKLIGNFEKPKYFHYDAAICAHHAYGQTGCTRCLDVCDADAIRSSGQKIEVNPYLCQGCGSCTLACPTGALSFNSPTRSELAAMLREQAAAAGPAALRLLVSDEPAPQEFSEGFARLNVRPLTAFGDELWLSARALGFEQVLLHATRPLEARSAALIQARIDVVNRMLAGSIPDEPFVRLIEGQPALPHLPASGRGEARAASLASEELDPGNKRPLLNSALAAIDATTKRGPTELPAGAALGTIRVDPDRCTLCSSCAKLCPTGAIDYSERIQVDTAVLSFLEQSCVQCGICAVGCPEQAITLQPRLASAAERAARRAIVTSPMAACADCGAGFAAQTLLDSAVRRLRASGATEVALEQAIRCPKCRAARLK